MSISVTDLRHFEGVHDRCSVLYCPVVRGEDVSDVSNVGNDGVECTTDELRRQFGGRSSLMDSAPPLYSARESCGCEACVAAAQLGCSVDQKSGSVDDFAWCDWRQEDCFAESSGLKEMKLEDQEVGLVSREGSSGLKSKVRLERTQKEWKVLGVTVCRKKEMKVKSHG